jgi:hypothetical protein
VSDSAPIIWFTEDPTPILVGGGLMLLVLAGFFLKTGRGLVLVGMAVVAMVMGLAVLVDRLVVTDREAVANTIYQAAAAAERNDLNAVMDFISPSAPEVKAEARRWIGQAKVESVSISAMEVTLDRAAKPMTATAEFRVYATGQLTDRRMPYPFNYLSRLLVRLQHSGDRWLVTEYERDR